MQMQVLHSIFLRSWKILEEVKSFARCEGLWFMVLSLFNQLKWKYQRFYQMPGCLCYCLLAATRLHIHTTLTLALLFIHLLTATAARHTCVRDLSVPRSVQFPDPALSFVQVPAKNRFNNFSSTSCSSSRRCGRHLCCRYSASGFTYSMVSRWQTLWRPLDERRVQDSHRQSLKISTTSGNLIHFIVVDNDLETFCAKVINAVD